MFEKNNQLNFHTTKTDDHMLKDLDQTECWDNWTCPHPNCLYNAGPNNLLSFFSVWAKTLKGLQNLHFRLANRVFFIDLIYFKLFTTLQTPQDIPAKVKWLKFIWLRIKTLKCLINSFSSPGTFSPTALYVSIHISLSIYSWDFIFSFLRINSVH